ncbi:MAG: hypothetical protein LWW85_09275, partial [Marinilabiliales bacterium]|nr:hypothetical protein [Marinilabiliales bacterium]
MATFLFDKTIFGPVQSRRLGVSLGINLLPNDVKLCSFDCIYCECGWNPEKKSKAAKLPSRDEVKQLLRRKLEEMMAESVLPDVITFAGNGEPTLHPEFAGIIDDTLLLRDALTPAARIAVLSNATLLHKKSVVEALKKVDDNILKLDGGIPETLHLLNKPVIRFSLPKLVEQLKQFDGHFILQTMFLRGSFEGIEFDNSSDAEVTAWMEKVKEIRPAKVMIYSIARDTPADSLRAV